MKKILLLFIISFSFIGNAQKLYKNKTATLNAIKTKGYSYAQDESNSNVYWYKRYDSYGESYVQLTFEGTALRKAIIVHLDPTETLKRLRDVYAKTTNSESLTFDPPSNGYGKGVASNTPYYSGKARYECSNNYNTKDYLFKVILLD